MRAVRLGTVESPVVEQHNLASVHLEVKVFLFGRVDGGLLRLEKITSGRDDGLMGPGYDAQAAVGDARVVES